MPGVVTENVWQQSAVANNRGVYVSYAYQRIGFLTEDGREVSVLLSTTGTNPPQYRVNEPVTIQVRSARAASPVHPIVPGGMVAADATLRHRDDFLLVRSHRGSSVPLRSILAFSIDALLGQPVR